MLAEKRAVVLQAASQNILTLTSACNLNCQFCSHKGNPPIVKTVRIRPLAMDDVKTALEFVDPGKKIFIGESAGLIEEGEPFTHPQISEILTLMRRRLPGTELSITTNATLLDDAALDWLAELQPIELVVSLNCLSVQNRRRVLGDKEPDRILNVIKLLTDKRINWHASIVAVPHLTGWDDLKRTISFAVFHGCKSLRIFLPGYTRWSPKNNTFDLQLWDELQAFIEGQRLKHDDVPLLLEPPRCRDLKPVIAGVAAETPASRAGLQAGDYIASVNGAAPRTRAEAFFLCQKASSPTISVLRNRQNHQFLLRKPSGSVPGFAMDRDLEPEIPQIVINTIAKKKSRQPLLLTSVAAGPLWDAARGIFNLPVSLKIISVKNCFFGGSIITAGLLTVSDFAAALAAESNYDLAIIPSIAFDERGKDITGRSWAELFDIAEKEIIMLP